MSLLRNFTSKSGLCVNQLGRAYHTPAKNTITVPDPLRYIVKDKSSWSNVPKDTSTAQKKLMEENKYVLRKADIEKKKCFQQMEDVQKQWYSLKKKNNIEPQRTYDPKEPNLWMRVRDMYATNNFFVNPESHYNYT